MNHRCEAVAVVAFQRRVGLGLVRGGGLRLGGGAAGESQGDEGEHEVGDYLDFRHAGGLSSGRATLLSPGESQNLCVIMPQNRDAIVPILNSNARANHTGPACGRLTAVRTEYSKGLPKAPMARGTKARKLSAVNRFCARSSTG